MDQNLNQVCCYYRALQLGKSTLLNTKIGDKVVIVSDKPQTTRNRIQCVLTRKLIKLFFHNSGIHKARISWVNIW